MGTLHLVAGPTARDTLLTALSESGRCAQDSVIAYPDVLSSGPLDPDTPDTRIHWWQSWPADMAAAQGTAVTTPLSELPEFWKKVEAADQIAVWYGRGNASESSFFHAMCAKLPDKPFNLITLDGAMGAHSFEDLLQHFGSSRPISVDERTRACTTWHRLQRENLTFRITRDGELSSAPADHYDRALLDSAGCTWTPIVRIVAPVMVAMNVGDSVLFWRIKTLVEAGAMISDGDPWLVRETKVKRTLQ